MPMTALLARQTTEKTLAGGASKSTRTLAGSPIDELAVKVIRHDRRAAEAARQLLDALSQEAAVSMRMATCEPGTPVHRAAWHELNLLAEEIAELEQMLRERPWTE
jgi:hypothetical protein